MRISQISYAVISSFLVINSSWAETASGVEQATSSKYATNEAEACDTALKAAEELAIKKAMTTFISITDKHCDCSEKNDKPICLGFVKWKKDEIPNLVD